jgi:SAM-dependent methyltransferase
MAGSTNLIQYYEERAEEYEKVYSLPERQEEVRLLKTDLANLFASHEVLEVSCGTGYWTEVIAQSANAVVATDINDKVLNIARRKAALRDRHVRLQRDNSFSLTSIQGKYTAGFAGFWWSHIPKRRLNEFLTVFHSKLLTDALVVLLDNNYVDGESSPIVREDDEGNSYQIRRLENGRTYEVIKNFPDNCELIETLKNQARDIHLSRRRYYWTVSYNVVS